MSPPPVPWFRGRTIVLAPSVVTPSQDAISIRALGGHAFTSPRKIRELLLPAATLVLAVAEGAALGFRGSFTASELPNDVVLAPVDPEDAREIERVLAEQLGLPRIPRRIAMNDLSRAEDGELVSVEGTYRDHHLDDVGLDGGNLEQGRRYRVLGFYRRTTGLAAVEITPLDRQS
jgi:hypothetical protein